MGHREADKKIKDRVLGDKPVSSNIQRTSIIDNDIKKLLVKNLKKIPIMKML